MSGKSRLFELKYTKFKTKNHFLVELSKVLEVVNFRFLAKFIFLTLQLSELKFLIFQTSRWPR